MLFPSIVYRSPGPFAGPPVDGHSTTYDTLGVADEVALQAALRAGWCRTLPEAVDAKGAGLRAMQAIPDEEFNAVLEHVPVADVSDLAHEQPDEAVDVASPAAPLPSRAELEKQARTLGVPFGNRISDEKLAERIAAKAG